MSDYNVELELVKVSAKEHIDNAASFVVFSISPDGNTPISKAFTGDIHSMAMMSLIKSTVKVFENAMVSNISKAFSEGEK